MSLGYPSEAARVKLGAKNYTYGIRVSSYCATTSHTNLVSVNWLFGYFKKTVTIKMVKFR